MFRQATNNVVVHPALRRLAIRSLASQSQNAVAKTQTFHSNSQDYHHAGWLYALGGLGLATAGTVTLMEAKKKAKEPHYVQPDGMIPKDTPIDVPQANRINQPPNRPDLPVFTIEEVAEHTDENSLWYTFRGGVYDLTPFYEGHPGGAPVRIINHLFNE